MENVIKVIASAIRGARCYADRNLAESKTYTDARIADGLPKVTEADDGKFLRVSGGKWNAEAVPNAEEASF